MGNMYLFSPTFEHNQFKCLHQAPTGYPWQILDALDKCGSLLPSMFIILDQQMNTLNYNLSLGLKTF
jgi:hypothetical protein